MKKFYMIAVLAIALLAIVVNAVPSFFIVEDSADLASQAGNTVSSSFTLNNDGSTNLDINFTGLTLTSGSNTLSISALANETDILSGTTRSASFNVVIPSSQTLGLYTGTLTAINGSLSDTITINVNVTPTFSVSTVSSINLGSSSLNKTKVSSFDITNNGDKDITNLIFKFSDTDFIFNTNKSNFTLAVGLTDSIGFNITIPPDFSTGNVTLGSINLESTEFNTILISLLAEIGGGLEVEDLDVSLTTRPIRKSDGILRSGSASDLDVVDGNKLDFDAEEAQS